MYIFSLPNFALYTIPLQVHLRHHLLRRRVWQAWEVRHIREGVQLSQLDPECHVSLIITRLLQNTRPCSYTRYFLFAWRNCTAFLVGSKFLALLVSLIMHSVMIQTHFYTTRQAYFSAAFQTVECISNVTVIKREMVHFCQDQENSLYSHKTLNMFPTVQRVSIKSLWPVYMQRLENPDHNVQQHKSTRLTPTRWPS